VGLIPDYFQKKRVVEETFGKKMNNRDFNFLLSAFSGGIVDKGGVDKKDSDVPGDYPILIINSPSA